MDRELAIDFEHSDLDSFQTRLLLLVHTWNPASYNSKLILLRTNIEMKTDLQGLIDAEEARTLMERLRLRSTESVRAINKNGNRTLDSSAPFLKLPGEILIIILRKLLINAGSSTETDRLYVTPHLPYGKRLEPAILRTSQTLYHFGIPILYGENNITVFDHSSAKNPSCTLERITPRNQQLIRKLTVIFRGSNDLWADLALIASNTSNITLLKELNVHFYLGVLDMTKQTGKEEVILKVARKILRDLVESLRVLKKLRITGFGDEIFAGKLEHWVKERKRRRS